MSDQPLPPFMLLRSFLTVGSAYVLCMISLIASLFLVGHLFFPDFVEFTQLDIATQKSIMETNPGSVIPPTMFWAVVTLNFLVCIGIGWLIIRTAPFAHRNHAIFLAVLLFIYFLQTAIADPPAKKSMTMVYLFAFPIAILIGSKLGLSRLYAVESDDNSLVP